MRKLICVLLFVVFVVQVYGRQNYFNEESDSSSRKQPKLALKIIPSQLLWRFPAFAIGLEQNIGSNLALDYTIGILQDRDVFNDDAVYFGNKSGFKSAIMFKSYKLDNGALGSVFDFLYGSGPYSSTITSYVGFEVFFNSMNFDRTRTFRFGCGNQCQFFQRVDYGLRMQEIGTRLNVGFLVDIIDPVGLEVNWAIGLMSRSFTEDNRKPVDYERSFGVFYDEEDSRIIGSFNMNIKLVINLK